MVGLVEPEQTEPDHPLPRLAVQAVLARRTTSAEPECSTPVVAMVAVAQVTELLRGLVRQQLEPMLLQTPAQVVVPAAMHAPYEQPRTPEMVQAES